MAQSKQKAATPIDGSATFAAVLKQLRKRAGLTQIQLAERAGLARPSIARLESGSRADPPLSVVLRLCQALSVPLSRFRTVTFPA